MHKQRHREATFIGVHDKRETKTSLICLKHSIAFWSSGVDRVESGRRQDRRDEEGAERIDLANHGKEFGLHPECERVFDAREKHNQTYYVGNSFLTTK